MLPAKSLNAKYLPSQAGNSQLALARRLRPLQSEPQIDAADHVRAISSLIFAPAFRFALGDYLLTEDVTLTLNYATFVMFDPAERVYRRKAERAKPLR
jgi:hypothetical protein